MAVYVDNFRTRAQIGGGRPAVWSHMTADTRDELHRFAARLGLRRSWFQDPSVNGKIKAKPGSQHAKNWHYDVTETVRQKAIRAGAVEVSWREFPAICARHPDEVPDLSEQPCGVCDETIVGNTRNSPSDMRVTWCHVEVPVGNGHRPEPVGAQVGSPTTDGGDC